MKVVGSDDSVILCGMNKTRVAYNTKVRLIQGFAQKGGKYPIKGERLICLKNDAVTNFRNGQLLRVCEDTKPIEPSSSCYITSLEEFPSDLVSYAGSLHCPDIQVAMRQLQEERTALNTLLEKNRQTDPLLLDYGYALSVHKAQGSEWERVLLIDERNRYMSDDDYTRWLYTTGVTRAKERLLIVS